MDYDIPVTVRKMQRDGAPADMAERLTLISDLAEEAIDRCTANQAFIPAETLSLDVVQTAGNDKRVDPG